MFLQNVTSLTVHEMNAEFISSVVVTGLTVVFLALILLIIFISLFGKIFDGINKAQAKKMEKQKAAPVEKAPSAKAVPVVEDGIDEETVAVIMAAVSAMNSTSKGFAVKSIKKSAGITNGWARAAALEGTKPF